MRSTALGSIAVPTSPAAKPGASARRPRSGSAGIRSNGVGGAAVPGTPVRRCAIYTRKSSEDGLEQAFNSLDAQREACAAYITSQRHEGWILLPTLYDDGGISGGTLERPALQRLLADIQSGRVDLVVVYKVDRLTRSLADFAKIVEVLDGHGASFVSITQQFNTTTSMGRLTLNMLLSFAQFEREVTGERIRDKIAASKRKGMWMGGAVPLGYDVRDRKLVVNAEEAETVRQIYRRYLELGSAHLLVTEMAEQGIRSKARPWLTNIKMQGGREIGRGALYTLLQNRAYRGEVEHSGQVYAGEHEAIVDAELWDAVQVQLGQNRQERREQLRAKEVSLLAGLAYDEAGERLTPTHATKAGKRYRYYVSQHLVTAKRGRPSPQLAAQRIPARDLEQLVSQRLLELLQIQTDLHRAITQGQQNASSSTSTTVIATAVHPSSGREMKRLLQRGQELAKGWSALGPGEQRQVLLAILHRVEVHAQDIRMDIDLIGLIAMLRKADSNAAPHVTEPSITHALQILTLTVPARLRRAGLEMALVLEGSSAARRVDTGLVTLLGKALVLQQRLIASDAATLKDFADREGLTPSWVTRVVRLAWLAPNIVQAIIEGRQPVELTAKRLLEDSRLPLGWKEQRQHLSMS